MIQPTRQTGFTLIEVIIVLAVSSIILSVAVPSFLNIIASNRVVTASNELITVLNLAKSEAVRGGKNTVLCKTENGSDCSTEGQWNSGWILFSDSNDDHIIDDDERIIRIQTEIDDSLNFTFRTGNYIRFYPNGRMNESGRFCFNNAYRQENSRAVIITQTVSIRTESRNSADDCAST